MLLLTCQTQSIRYEINKLEMEKTKAMSHVFKFKRLIGEVEKNFGAEKKSAQPLPRRYYYSRVCFYVVGA